MRYKGPCVAAVAASLVSGLAFLAPSRADHGSSPREVTDPAANIADVYAFMRPGGAQPSSHIVLVMTMNPNAVNSADPDAATQFSDKVEYTFRVERVTSIKPLTLTNTDYRITCHFIATTPQQVTCILPGVGSRTVPVNELDGGALTDDVRIFAGLRSDPAFFDLEAYKKTVSSGTLSFANPGTYAYQGKNVASLVIELNVALAFNLADAGTPTPILAVAGEATRQ
jgi:hypothetical protein